MPEDYRKYLLPQVVSTLANMELRARLVVEGFIAGLHRSPYHGFSVEFAEHRPYMPGDEIRHVVGDRIYNAYYPNRLFNHDGEDAKNMVWDLIDDDRLAELPIVRSCAVCDGADAGPASADPVGSVSA